MFLPGVKLHNSNAELKCLNCPAGKFSLGGGRLFHGVTVGGLSFPGFTFFDTPRPQGVGLNGTPKNGGKIKQAAFWYGIFGLVI